jgi:Domain of unknown function (DUF4148)
VAKQPLSNADGAENSAVTRRFGPSSPLFNLHLKDTIMNTKTFVIAAFAVVTTFGMSPAVAGEATYDYPVAQTSAVSRADVKAETVRARAAGLIAHGERNVVIADSGPALTRAQVKAETLEAIRVGAIDRHEHNIAPTAAQLDSIRMAGLKAAMLTMASL